MPAARPEEGTTSNRYTILGKLAGGGMADIFLAKAISEGGVERYVVLKRVLAERSRDPHFAQMFLDEARLAAQLQHPNIAQVHDIGKLAGSYFFTMEYVHGEDVRNLLHSLSMQERAFPVNLALHVAAGALAALHHAHTRTGADGTPLEIVHRDVSPSNVMVSYEGAIKLLDFGVAKAAQRSVESQSGAIKGKIAYLSPEQCQGKPIDRRSDIFALGIILFELLTRQRLYKRETDFGAMMAIATEVPAAPSTLRPEVSPELEAIVLTALAKDPDARYATAADMLEAIETVAAHERHVLSATAMGRFLREVFGERPLPWVALPEADAESTEMTVTSSFSGDLPDLGDVALLEQLAHAPAIAPHPAVPADPPITAVTTPASGSGSGVPRPIPAAASGGVARPAAGSGGVPRPASPAPSAPIAKPPPASEPVGRPPFAPGPTSPASEPLARSVSAPPRAASPPSEPLARSGPPLVRPAPTRERSNPTSEPAAIQPAQATAPAVLAVGPPTPPPPAPERWPANATTEPVPPAITRMRTPSQAPPLPATPRPSTNAPAPSRGSASYPPQLGPPEGSPLAVAASHAASSGSGSMPTVAPFGTYPTYPVRQTSERPAPRSNRLVIAAVIAVGCIVGIVLAVTLGGSSPAPARDAAIATVTADAVVAPRGVDAAAVAAAALDAAVAEPDASIAETPPDAAAPTAGERIAALIARGDDDAALRLCASEKLDASDPARCALAACDAGEREPALRYLRAVTKADRPAIERACRTHNVSLEPVRPPVHPPGTHPAPDPCEANPVQCQK